MENEMVAVSLPRVSDRLFDLLDVSEGTRNDYRNRIKLFLGFIAQKPITRSTFLDFKRELAKRTDLTPSTKNKYLTCARLFLKEAARRGVLPDITQGVKGFSQSRKHKRDGLNEQEIALLTEEVKKLPETPQNARLRAILTLLTVQGLRQVEIVRLNVQDLDLVNKTAMIWGKGRDDKERVDLHPETVTALTNYLKLNRIADGPLFVSRSNNSRAHRLTTRAIRWIVKGLLKDLAINKTVHGFRHFFVTKLVKDYKGDLLQVAGYSRHKSLEMLQVYNDAVKRQEDLPRFYSVFNGISF